MIQVKLPQLLDAGLHPVRRLHPQSFSLVKQLIPVSSVRFALPRDEAPSVGEWLNIFSPCGGEGLYRIVSTDILQDAAGGRCTVYAEHALCTLGDTFIHTAVDMENKTVRQVLAYILSRQTQSRWQLGRCAIGGTLCCRIGKMTLLQAFDEVLEQYRGDYLPVCDFGTSPWTVHIDAAGQTPECECRLSRNLQSVRVNIDRTDMVNRLYCPDWKQNGETPVPPRSVQDDASIAQWGEVSAEFTDSTAADNDTVLQRAAAYLRQVKDPVISVTLDACELSQLTGDDLDRFQVGRMCRVALPDSGYTANERIITVTYPDMYARPDSITLTLANRVQSTSTGLTALQKQARGSRGRRGGSAAKDAEKAGELLIAHDRRISLVVTPDGEIDRAAIIMAMNDRGQSSIRLHADVIDLSAYDTGISGIHERLDTIEGSQLWLDRESIVSSVGAIGMLAGKVSTIEGSSIWQNRDSITAAVGMMCVGADGRLHITDGGGLVIDSEGVSHGVYTDGNLTAGVIVNRINGGTVKIKAKNIELDGNTIAGLLDAQDVTVHSLGVAGSVVCEDISVQDISDCYINDILFSTHSHAITVDGGRVTFGQVVAQPQNFNIADTQFYRDGVSASYTNGFNKAKIEYKPDNIVYVGGTTEWQSDGKKVTQTLRAINEAGQYLFEKSYSVDTTTGYNKGYGDGRTDFRPTVIGYQSGQLIEWADDGKSCVLPLQARNINGESLVIRNMTLGTSNAYNKGYSDGQDSKNVNSVSGESISYSNLNQRLALTAIAKNSSGTVLKRNNIYLSTANVYQYSEWTTAKPADLTGWTEVNVFNSLNGSQTKYEKCLKIVVTDYMNRTTTVYNSTQAKDFYIHQTQVTANTTKRYYKPSVCDFRNVTIE